VPSTNEVSKEKELEELLKNNVDSAIAKPDKLLKDKEITSLYKRFRSQIEILREEEEREAKVKREL